MDDPRHDPIGFEAALASGAPADVLVPCDVAGILDAALMLRAHAGVLELAGAALARVEVTNWRGRAADGFADVLAPEPARWRSAADGFLAGAAALEGFVASIAPARATAGEAVCLYQRYLQTAAAAAALVGVAPAPPLPDRMQVGARIAQQQTAASSGAAGASLTSDADSLRRQAISMLAAARRTVQAAGDLAVDTLARASENAPQARRFWEANIRPADIVGTGHAALDGVGMIPAAGVVPDAVNATWYAASGDGTSAAISATGAVPVLGAMFIGGRWISKAVRPMEKLTGEVANPMPERLYISGNRTPTNMTPRPQDVTGLSSYDNLDAPVFSRGGKVQEVETARLKELRVHGPDGHYSIRPASAASLAEWIWSRQGSVTHPYTEEMLESLGQELRLPRTAR